jgi:hypothetical protein
LLIGSVVRPHEALRLDDHITVAAYDAASAGVVPEVRNGLAPIRAEWGAGT